MLVLYFVRPSPQDVTVQWFNFFYRKLKELLLFMIVRKQMTPKECGVHYYCAATEEGTTTCTYFRTRSIGQRSSAFGHVTCIGIGIGWASVHHRSR